MGTVPSLCFALFHVFAFLSEPRRAEGSPQTWAVGSRVVVKAKDGDYLVDRIRQGRRSFIRARGVQYAQHPVGELRWQPPLRMPSWSSPMNATAFGSDCVNAPWYNRLESIGFDKQAEECLYLNVWSPLDDGALVHGSQNLKPVEFWIHGGSFVVGGTSRFSADRLLDYRPDAVVVTANYRLGGLGFLGGKAVAATTPDGSAGNFAIQDTRAALAWVQRNIANFGGDPDRVTIFGESSGASMVAVHLVAPRSRGLFHRAIMESGPFDNFTMQTSCDASFAAFADAANCKRPNEAASLACLRSLPLKSEAPWPDPRWNTTGLLPAIANTSKGGWFGPCIDGVEMKAEPEAYAAAGQINPVSGVILGTNQNEGRFLMPFNSPVPNAPISSMEDVRTWLEDNDPYDASPDLPSRILEIYNGTAKTPWETATLIYTESQYLCPTARSARWLRASGKVRHDNIFVYRLDYESSLAQRTSEFFYWLKWCNYWKLEECRNATMVDPGVGHGTDVGLVWLSSHLNASDLVIGKRFVDYWQNFAGTGNPNGMPAAVGGAWPRYGSSHKTLVIDRKSHVEENSQMARCKFWDDLHKVPPLPS